MKPRTIFTRGAPPLTVRQRMAARMISRDLNPHLMQDIGLDPLPDHPPIPPFAAFIPRV